MNEFIPMLVAFIILWVILAKFGWLVFDRMLEKRANTFAMTSKRRRSPPGKRTSARKYKQQLAEAKAEASRIVSDAKKTYG
ncbi:MAG: ATP synthase F0 subunit B [Eggerthellaceae bacterium]